ncbi:MAG: hypothetical protein JO080_16410 [Mucilaginibacter sp.]|nr:hypothetical protein [Mucilaginibacter sp.]
MSKSKLVLEKEVTIQSLFGNQIVPEEIVLAGMKDLDLCVTDSVHADGFIGLYVGRYDLSGGFNGTVVNQQISLWNDSSWWAGTTGSGSNSAFPLFSQFNVDSDHWYAMWVWCGTHIETAGFNNSPTWGSGAYGIMDVTVPSITWELFG